MNSRETAPLPSVEDDYGDGLDDGCWNCGGEGFIVVCWDDMCQGAGECMHGDGEIVCPTCGGY